MTTIDPATGRPLSDSAIQRVLFVTDNVHVYQIPPLISSKGFSASSWTAPPRPTAQQIFTARLRIIETSVEGKLKADVVLEDPKSGDLFAAAPYTSAAVVEQAQDSSRFFAVRVQGEGGMKATLGIGFEDRSPAFDFSIALRDVKKVLDMEVDSTVRPYASSNASKKLDQAASLEKDWSLKEGEKIHIEFGGASRRAVSSSKADATATEESAALFSIAPPPTPLSRPDNTDPSAEAASTGDEQTAAELGFDDGEFGEFQ